MSVSAWSAARSNITRTRAGRTHWHSTMPSLRAIANSPSTGCPSKVAIHCLVHAPAGVNTVNMFTPS